VSFIVSIALSEFVRCDLTFPFRIVVKQEATTEDIFKLLIQAPQSVLAILGSEQKYRSLLRRVAANPPFSRVSSQIRSSPFLLAYSLKSTEKKEGAPVDSTTFRLAKADDIFIVDNSVFGRMFIVDRAPPESDLQDFYAMLGSKYISKSVDRRFEVAGRANEDTSLTRALKERILERSPLLVSPSVTSRPLVSDAASILSENRLTIFEAPSLMAVYSLGGVTRRSSTTCFSRNVSGLGANKNAIYVVDAFDWFDVGYAIGDLILKRCQLEDAFFISSLLEAPLDQLRARGFPVDRILKPAPALELAPVVIPPPVPTRTDAPSGGPQQAAPDKPKSQPSATLAAASAASAQNANTQQESESEGFEQIMKQMYPDADENYIRAALGKNASLDDVQRLATNMSSGNYPKKETSSDSAAQEQGSTKDDEFPKKKKAGLRSRLGRALGGLKGSGATGSGSGAPPPTPPQASTAGGQSQSSDTSGGDVGPAGPSTGTHHESTSPVSAAADAQSQNKLDEMLQNTVNASTNVNRQGVQSQQTQLASIPKELDRGDTCEVVPGHSLKPFPGPRGSAKTQNGIRVFSSRSIPGSEVFLTENQESLEAFALVLERLSSVYRLQLDSIAIFHDPSGGTIAFNSNRALHFNVRFFHALHFLQGKHLNSDCYSYWFVTTAHELAHHLVHAHSKEHGFYTESYMSLYLPKLMEALGRDFK